MCIVCKVCVYTIWRVIGINELSVKQKYWVNIDVKEQMWLSNVKYL